MIDIAIVKTGDQLYRIGSIYKKISTHLLASHILLNYLCCVKCKVLF